MIKVHDAARARIYATEPSCLGSVLITDDDQQSAWDAVRMDPPELVPSKRLSQIVAAACVWGSGSARRTGLRATGGPWVRSGIRRGSVEGEWAQTRQNAPVTNMTHRR